MVLQSTDRSMTSSVTYICKQVIPLIPSKCKAMKYITLLFPKVLRTSLWFILLSNLTSGTVLEFVVTDGVIEATIAGFRVICYLYFILNFWRFKEMNIGF